MIRADLFRGHLRSRESTLLAITLGLLAAVPAQAATLQQVSNWNGGIVFPSDVTMYSYIPGSVATNPPILTLVHYCGGTASAVFSQAQAGGIVAAADQYGFIMVVPSSGRCWDVVSSKTRTHDGGGDSHAIAQMVRYAITTYQANADRVYSTGDSSGGMMTELLLAAYPDIFKAGSSFAGMPAGCGTTTSSSGGYDGSCAGGNVTHTAQQWGDLVRPMDPGYTGHRPRLQLFHGDADGTISYKNMGESAKMYINLLNLSTMPTSTVTGLTLGTHQATRQEWQNSCGYLVLDAFSSIGGDHGPSDALFAAQYVVPFLGLDSIGAVDPEIQQCSSGGTGGATGTGGVTGTGGALGTGGVTGTGGAVGTGGMVGTGGVSGTGGVAGTGGMVGSGGGGTGGINGSGGVVATGGVTGTGGIVGTGGILGTGGLASAGGATGRGGGSDTGGSSGIDAAIGSGGVISTGGASYGVDAAGVSTTGGAAGDADAGLAVDANVAPGGIGGGSGGGGSVALGDGPVAHDLSGFDAPAYSSSVDARVINGGDTGVGATPGQAGRHGLYALPSCNFGRGRPGTSGVFILLAMLLLRRRSSRHRG